MVASCAGWSGNIFFSDLPLHEKTPFLEEIELCIVTFVALFGVGCGSYFVHSIMQTNNNNYYYTQLI